MKAPDTVKRFLRYESDTGEQLWLAVPWGPGSGRIPPPFVRFVVLASGQVVTFAYYGEED